MNTNHVESELKFEVPQSVSTEAFEKWAQRQKPLRHVSVSGLDTFYQQGDNVVRHRCSGRSQELTIKQRQSKDSITHRLEVDLFFSAKTTQEDVRAFLMASGWRPVLTIHKTSTIYNLAEDEGEEICLALYCVDGSRRFMEVELVKGGSESVDAAAVLDYWHKKLTKAFPGIGAPLNASLFEIYSGRKQKVQKAVKKVMKDHHKTLAALAAIPD
jgi:adenylate cyclase class IV